MVEDKLLELGRAIEAKAKTGQSTLFKADNLPPPVVSSPLDRGWHIALTPLRASAIRDYLDVRAMNGCPAKAVGSIAGDADKALGHGLAPSRGSDKRRSSGAWAGSTRPRHPLSSSAQNHLRAQARQPGLGAAECLWRRSEPLTRSRRRRLRARWRGIHFRSPDPQEFYSRGALRRRIPLLLRRVVGVKAHGTSAEHSVVRIPASFPAPAREKCRSRCHDL